MYWTCFPSGKGIPIFVVLLCTPHSQSLWFRRGQSTQGFKHEAVTYTHHIPLASWLVLRWLWDLILTWVIMSWALKKKKRPIGGQKKVLHWLGLGEGCWLGNSRSHLTTARIGLIWKWRHTEETGTQRWSLSPQTQTYPISANQSHHFFFLN